MAMISLRIDPALLRRVDEARGKVPRGEFVRRCLERELAAHGPFPLDPPCAGAPVRQAVRSTDVKAGVRPIPKR